MFSHLITCTHVVRLLEWREIWRHKLMSCRVIYHESRQRCRVFETTTVNYVISCLTRKTNKLKYVLCRDVPQLVSVITECVRVEMRHKLKFSWPRIQGHILTVVLLFQFEEELSHCRAEMKQLELQLSSAQEQSSTLLQQHNEILTQVCVVYSNPHTCMYCLVHTQSEFSQVKYMSPSRLNIVPCKVILVGDM